MKYSRIKKNADFQKIFSKGKRVFSPCLTVLFFPSSQLRMGVAVSKKHGKAVKRNRIKRLCRAAFSDTCGLLERNYSVIILPKVSESYEFKAFKKSLEACFKKVNSCEKS